MSVPSYVVVIERPGQTVCGCCGNVMCFSTDPYPPKTATHALMFCATPDCPAFEAVVRMDFKTTILDVIVKKP